MSIIFSDHAFEQIKRRGIPEELIVETAREPEEIFSSYRGRKLRRRRIDDRILEVVTKTEGSRITIITAYFLEK
jgi:hypothetical protein